MTGQGRTNPSWWTVGGITLFFSVGSSFATAFIKFVDIKNDLSAAINRVQELERSNGQLNGYIAQWREANTQLQTQLNTSNSRLLGLQNDRCAPLREEVDSIGYDLKNAERWGYSTSRILTLRELSHEYQLSLRACYGDKT